MEELSDDQGSRLLPGACRMISGTAVPMWLKKLTGNPGVYVKLEDTIHASDILAGKQ